jgi:prolyl-tRNA synthetase
MPDGKFLQCGTSHNLGQGFAEAFNITFKGEDEKEHFPWQNSWGISTRLIGALVMQHGDDKGLILPPSIAPIQLAIIPILLGDKENVIKQAEAIAKELSSYETKVDTREEYSPGWKFNQYEMKGVPLRLEIGPKDIEKKQVVLVRRDTGEKHFVKMDDLKAKVKELLDDIQKSLLVKAEENLQQNIVEAKDWNDFLKAAEARKIIHAPFCGEESCEDAIKDETKGATSRCFDMSQDAEKVKGKKCIKCDKQAKGMAYFGKCY